MFSLSTNTTTIADCASMDFPQCQTTLQLPKCYRLSIMPKFIDNVKFILTYKVKIISCFGEINLENRFFRIFLIRYTIGGVMV